MGKSIMGSVLPRPLCLETAATVGDIHLLSAIKVGPLAESKCCLKRNMR